MFDFDTDLCMGVNADTEVDAALEEMRVFEEMNIHYGQDFDNDLSDPFLDECDWLSGWAMSLTHQ